MAENTVTLHVEGIPEEEAWAIAQFFKRAGYSDYIRCANNDEEAYGMLYAGEKIAHALAEAGVAPR